MNFGCDINEPFIPRLYSVRKVKRETHDVFTLELEPVDGNGLAFCPGQFNMLYIFGVGEVPISISGNPVDPDKLVHTVREVGAVTKSMCNLRQGDVIGVRGPFGNCWPIDEAEGNDIVIVAGGIGLAPLRPVMYKLLSQREKYGRIVLLYGARSPEDILYQHELERWRARFDVDVFVTVDRATRTWYGNVGVVTKLIVRASFDPDNTTAFVCGPEVMMRFTALELEKYGLSGENIFISMERNMKCAIGFCGHCQFGPLFICKDGPVFRYDSVRDLLSKREI
jgi:NAD(P)H-flavin reductase